MDRTKVLHGPRTQTYGETNYLKYQVLDRTKILHGPWTQTYGETNYLRYQVYQGITWSSDLNLWENQLLIKSSFGQNQGIAWSLDSNLWGNQLL